MIEILHISCERESVSLDHVVFLPHYSSWKKADFDRRSAVWSLQRLFRGLRRLRQKVLHRIFLEVCG